MKKTVSLFLFHDNEAILAVRSQGQHYAGVLQATAHGEIESEFGEKESVALGRELLEETSLTLDMVNDLRYLDKKKVGVRKEEECGYYAGSVPFHFYKLIHPCGEIERFITVGKESIKKIQPFSAMKKIFLTPESHISPDEYLVMFDDELEILQTIFQTMKTVKTAQEKKAKGVPIKKVSIKK